jgi:hypothetical protein
VDLTVGKRGTFFGMEEREPMARRTFDLIDISEILIHWYAGRSQGEIAASETHTWRLVTSWRSDSRNAPSPFLARL